MCHSSSLRLGFACYAFTSCNACYAFTLGFAFYGCEMTSLSSKRSLGVEGKPPERDNRSKLPSESLGPYGFTRRRGWKGKVRSEVRIPLNRVSSKATSSFSSIDVPCPAGSRYHTLTYGDCFEWWELLWMVIAVSSGFAIWPALQCSKMKLLETGIHRIC